MLFLKTGARSCWDAADEGLSGSLSELTRTAHVRKSRPPLHAPALLSSPAPLFLLVCCAGEESADLTTDSVISNLRSSSYRMEAASPPSPRSGLASPSSPPRSPSWRGPVRGVPVLPLQDSGVSSADTQES